MYQVCFYLFAAVATYLLSQPVPAGANRCRGSIEPDHSKFVRTETLHDSFYNIDALAQKMKTLEKVPPIFIKTRYYYLHGQRECVALGPDDFRHGGTLCPSYSVLNYDENRDPVTLVEAKCSCRGCRQHPDDTNESTLTCQPLIYFTSVFRRVGCTDNVYDYEQVLEPLTVGCTCGAPKTNVTRDISSMSRPTNSQRRRRRRSILDLFKK